MRSTCVLKYDCCLKKNHFLTFAFLPQRKMTSYSYWELAILQTIFWNWMNECTSPERVFECDNNCEWFKILHIQRREEVYALLTGNQENFSWRKYVCFVLFFLKIGSTPSVELVWGLNSPTSRPDWRSESAA